MSINKVLIWWEILEKNENPFVIYSAWDVFYLCIFVPAQVVEQEENQY